VSGCFARYVEQIGYLCNNVGDYIFKRYGFMLKIGTQLTLQPLDQEHLYKCRVADIKGDRLFIDYPIDVDTNKTVFLLNEQSLTVEFVLDNGAYRFNSKVIGREKRNVPVLVLSYPEEEQIHKIQRRQYVRVNATVDVSLHFFESDTKIITVTKDISAGGCAVLLPDTYTPHVNEEGKALAVLPFKSNYHYLWLPFSVVRTKEFEEQHIASLKFHDTTGIDRQIIIRYCFQQQVKMRQKGIDM